MARRFRMDNDAVRWISIDFSNRTFSIFVVDGLYRIGFNKRIATDRAQIENRRLFF